jgi:serine/threonine protein kinase
VEVENLKKFRSDHIIEYYECFKEDQGNKIVLNVVMNLSSGSLRDLINKKKKFSPS